MITAVKCKWLKRGETLEVPVGECLACAGSGRNPCGYTLPLLSLSTRNRDPEEVRCSATMFGGCPRQHGIQKHHEYAVDPERTYTRAFGSLVHLGAETVHRHHGGADIERRLARSIRLDDGREMTVTAAMDILHVDEDGKARIRDYKVVPSVSDSEVGRRLEHHIPQFSVQRWILAAHDIEVEDITLVFLAHKSPRTVNLYPHGEPEFANSYIYSFERTEAYLKERGPALLDSLEGRFPPPLEKGPEGWRCRYCDVSQVCEELYGESLPALR